MKYFNYKKIVLYSLFLVGILFSWQSAYAQITSSTRTRNRPRTYDIQYQEQDIGRSRVTSALRSQINELNDEPIVSNPRIPILLGVKVSDLEDTWGDARANGRTHEGIDILAPRESLIVSPTDAIVTTIENSGNGGNHVFTANPGGERYYYAHLDSFAEGLQEGQVLKAGDPIGYVGNTGNASAGPTHLHFGIYENDHNVINPFLRLTLEFSLRDKMTAVAKFLSSSTDATTLARSLAGQYKNTFIEAQASGITIPSLITQILTEKRAGALGITRILKIGMSGDDVKWLQGALGIPADGSFGPQTKAALVAFQRGAGISADGIFGAATRITFANSSIATTTLPTGCTGSTAYSPTTGIKCVAILAY